MSFENLEPIPFKEALDSSQNAVLLDVRTPEEIAAAKIDGAVELNFFEGDFSQRITELDKGKDYFVYCRSGNRSGQTCAFMLSNGFNGRLVNLQGGIMAWETTTF